VIRLRFREAGILLVLAGMGLILWLIAPRVDGVSTFLNRDNLMQVARAVTFIGTAAIGATIVIAAGGIDLSAGSVLGLAVVVAALALGAGRGIGVSCAVALLAALVCGLLNGWLIARTGLPPFIVTLGMLSIARGAAYWLSGGRILSGLPEDLVAWGQGAWGVVPKPVAVMLVLGGLAAAGMTRTAFGRSVLAVGGNEAAALLSGLPVARVKIAVYALGSLFAGVAGLLYTARFGYGSSTAGVGYELQIISAVVIGGTSLAGGDGTVIGTLLGAGVMGLLTNGLTLLSVPEEYNQVVVGLVIILAVLADRFRRRATVP
jgi:ribose/xylose/arabinose/galactoside ABC-type transport system permease subunit